MAKIVEFKKKISKIFGKKDEEESEKGEEIGSYSMNEGKTEKVFGINRKIVTGIGGFFGLVFVMAIIFAAMDSGEKTAKVDSKNISEDEIANTVKAKNNLPSDYESFVAMTAEKNKAQEVPQEKPQQTKAVEKPAEVKTQTTTTPVIPKSSYPEIILPQQNQSIPQVQIPKLENSEPEKKSAAEKVEKEKYNAPIAFGSFEKKDSEKNSEAEVTEKQSTKVSYQKTNLGGIGAGTIMSARLLTGINSEVEGQVVAQILSDVYNAGRTKILIPQGSKIIGAYEKVSGDRVPVEFEKIILPDGGTLSVEKNLVAVDGAGYTGIKGKVHHHTGRKISAGVMGAALAAIGSTAAGNSSSGNNNYSAGELAKQGAMANLMNVTSKIFENASKIENTVTVEPGYEFQIYVKEDLEF